MLVTCFPLLLIYYAYIFIYIPILQFYCIMQFHLQIQIVQISQLISILWFSTLCSALPHMDMHSTYQSSLMITIVYLLSLAATSDFLVTRCYHKNYFLFQLVCTIALSLNQWSLASLMPVHNLQLPLDYVILQLKTFLISCCCFLAAK